MHFLKNRYKLLIISLLIFLSTSLITRVLLTAISFIKSEIGLGSLLKIYSLGLLFDLAFYFYFCIPLFIYITFTSKKFWNTKTNKVFTQICLVSFIGFNVFNIVSELLFWNEFEVRFNFIAVDYLIYTKEVIDNIVESYPLITIFSWVFIFVFGIFYLVSFYLKDAYKCEVNFKNRLKVFLFLIIVPVIFYAFLNQETRKFSDNSYQNELASNGPYQFVAAFRNNEMDFSHFYPTLLEKKADEIAAKVLNVTEKNSSQNFDYLRKTINQGQEKKHNVVMIMIESLSSNFMTYFGNKKSLTPVLDSLITKSRFYSDFYATGTRTTRGLEAVSLSLPPIPGRSIVKRMGRESGMISLGSIFNEKGYDSKFIYGGRGYFDNMNAFFGGNGYDIIDQHSVSGNEIKFQNAWGMADEHLYEQVIKAADKNHKENIPFFYHVMTTSNHRPYTYPNNRIDIPSGTGRDGAVKYTDWAIGDFLKKASKTDWYDNTLFVIVADHQASSAGKVDLPLQRYHIPLFFFQPNKIKPETITKVCSQIDLPVTILAELNFSYSSLFFGKNISQMKPNEERAFIGTYQALGLYKNHNMFILKPVKQMVIHKKADTKYPKIVKASVKDQSIQEIISIYQAADAVYHRGLNKVVRLKGMIK